MKFQIKRTSHGYSQHPTLKDETPESDRVGDAEDYPHVWTVEIYDLGDLMSLGKRENAPTKWAGRNRPWPFRIIVGLADGDELPTHEIYDTYRE